MSHKARAFTLIELLVVITIIVVLLALLAPALDKAIYQAELAQCAASQRAIAGGAILYAFDHKRRYPNRPGNREDEDTTSWTPYTLAMANQSNNPLAQRDLRPIIKQHIGPKLWQDVFAEKLDLTEEATEGAGRVFGGYALFFGFTYTRDPEWLGNPAPEAGMIRMGDRWTFTNNDPAENTTHRFSVLTIDVDYVKGSGGGEAPTVSHPDEDGALAIDTFRNRLAPWPLDGTWVGSWFKGFNRGPIDMNASRDDGSVSRYLRVNRQKNANPGFTDVALFDTRFEYPDSWLKVPTN